MDVITNKNLKDLVKESLYKYIKEIDHTHNNKLPNEETLSSLLNVSRITVRSALNELASEGLIFRKHGKGTFINTEALKMNIQLSPMKLYKDIIKNSGYESSIKNISFSIKELDDLKISKALNISLKEKIVIVKKTFYADKIPCCYCINYFPLSFIKNELIYKNIKKYKDSVFEFLEIECNKNIIWEKAELSIADTLNTAELNDIFQCNNKMKPFLLITGTNYDENNNPAVYAKEYVDTEIISFSFIRQRVANT